MHQHSNGTIAQLGSPRCGDGTNYSFLVSRPEEKPQQGEKILIELTGGGACWDELTCNLQQSWLSFPQWLSSFVGTSCSGLGGNLLCAKSIGSTDFSEYTTVIIPYCTQDVHLGDEPNTSYGVQHVGAHNMYRTLQWIFENFPNPSDIFITGCSAGGTPLPVVYDLINTHYNNAMVGGENLVEIDVIIDSSVFLTPSHFLENYMPNWNVGTILNKIGFDFDAYKDKESFPSELLDHALQRSKETDQFGFVSHDADQVSLYYYRMMKSGSLLDLFGRGRLLSSTDPGLDTKDESATSTSNFRRRMNDDIESQWWSELNNSMTLAMNGHNNFDAFVMDGEGHCSFSLNVPLQYEGFEEWASTIMEQDLSIIMQLENESTTPALSTNSSIVPAGPPATDPTAAANNMAAQQASSSFAITAIIMLTLRFLSSHAR